jgi:hypothetical protein
LVYAYIRDVGGDPKGFSAVALDGPSVFKNLPLTIWDFS